MGCGLRRVAKPNPLSPPPPPPAPTTTHHPSTHPPRRRNLSIKINSSKAQLLRLQKEADPLSRQPQLERQLAQQRKKALSAVSSAASFGGYGERGRSSPDVAVIRGSCPDRPSWRGSWRSSAIRRCRR